MKEYPVYKGLSRQYGYGLGSIFKSAMRTVIPILKPIAKAGLKSVKEQGLEAIKDIASGQNAKQVLKRRGTSAATSTLNRLVRQKPIKKAAKKKNYRHTTSHDVFDNKRKSKCRTGLVSVANQNWTCIPFHRP